MATGDVTAVIRSDGWSADVTVEGRAAWLGLATVDPGTPGDTTTANLYFNVTSEGYSSAGALGTVARVVYGTKLVLMPYGTQAIPGTLSGTFTDGETVTQATSGATGKVYGASQGATHAHLVIHTVTGTPNGANVWTGGTSGQTVTPSGTPAARTNDERVVGSNIVYRIALSEYIFDDDKNGGAGTSGTDPVMYARAALVTQGGNDSNAASGVSCTNNSTKDYPAAFGQWDVYAGALHRSRVKANFTLACNAFHGFGVAAVRFNTVGGTSAVDSEEYVTRETPTQRTATSLYAWAHQRTVTLSAFTQGETLTSRFRIYPKVGDANSVFDTSGRTTANEECRCYNEHVLICDKSNLLDNIKYVSSTGNDTTGDGSSGNPWLTISKATTTAGVNVVRLMGSATYDTGSSATRKTSSEWVVVEANSGATPTVRIVATTTTYRVQRLMFSGLPIIPSAIGAYMDGENLNYLCFKNCAFSRNGVGDASLVGPSYQSYTTYMINCTGDMSEKKWVVFAFSTAMMSMVCDGVVFATSTTYARNWYRVVACSSSGACSFIDKVSGSSSPTQNNVVYAYNKFTGGTWGSLFHLQVGASNNVTGVAIVGNVNWNNDGINGVYNLCADTTAYTGANFIFAHNTTQPAADTARNNLFYNDNSSGAGVWNHSDIYAYGNDMGRANIKSDVFATNAKAIGNWPQVYGVGWRNNNTDSLSSGSFDWRYRGVGNIDVTPAYVNAGAYDYTPDTGSGTLDHADQSLGFWRFFGDQAGTYASIDATAQANVGALQPVPTVTITADGEATSDGGSTDVGMHAADDSIPIAFTAGGLTGATLYISAITGTGGALGVLTFGGQMVTSGGSVVSESAVLDDSGAGHIEVSYSIGDGTYDFDLTWGVRGTVGLRVDRTGRVLRSRI